MTPDIQQAVVQVLSDLIRLAALVVAGYVAAWVRQHVTAARWQRAQDIARTAVWAVEQMAPGLGLRAKAKLDQALQAARRLAASHGLRLTDDEWRSLIEAAVKALKDAGAEIKAAAAH
ncbi:MAG: phage holin, LLH family [Bacillota bacterium]|nr:phage holin, LLH family [Bacillota bacterium]